MPANLNALIRYKTIDRCLSNGHRQWSIQDLIEACSDSLGEYRGIYKTVSERTIRDDLRVMRSDMLGFNAPIVFGEGNYSYSDTSYSIFNVRVSDDKLLSRILELLIEIRTEISHPELEKMIERLSGLIPFKTGRTAEPVEDEPRKEEPRKEELRKEELRKEIDDEEELMGEDMAIPEAPPVMKAPEDRKFSRRRGILASISLRSSRGKSGALPSQEVPAEFPAEFPAEAHGGYVFSWSGVLEILA